MIRQSKRIPTRRATERRRRPELFFKREKPDVFIYLDGREVCNMETAAGREEYRNRVRLMLRRQNGKCCNCQKPLYSGHATFEHENGRGAAKQDDRIEINGLPVNGASHDVCNVLRGSKRTPIWHGPEPQIFHTEG